MGLTRPRAQQIYDIDYKQATRVVTTTNINLSGGAPSQVDGVTLSTNDRVLVTGQTTASQNGIYYVTTLGSGANGTWSRSTDSNQTGELLAGTIVMVTEGSVYADTQWKLITDNPIVIDATPLTFTQNYSANSISGGTSNVVVNSNANVTISAAGTANVLTVSNTGAYVSGVVSATGNITGNYILGNIAFANGIPATYSNANVANYLPIFSGNLTAGNVSVSGNITGGNILTVGNISASGNITGNYFIGNGSQLTGLATGIPAQIANGTSNINIASANGNIEFAVGSSPDTMIVSPGELTVYGVYSNPKTISSNIAIAPNINSLLIGPVSIAAGINIYVPDSSTLNIV
jgi:hypothetical protein